MFQAVNDAVRVIVGGVHTPLVAGVGVRHVLDTIRDLCGRKNVGKISLKQRSSPIGSLNHKARHLETKTRNDCYLVPHVGVGGEHVHLHTQSGLICGVLALAHVLELPQRLLDGSKSEMCMSLQEMEGEVRQ